MHRQLRSSLGIGNSPMDVAGQSAAWPGNCSSHRAAKCQEDQHDIHLLHLTSQASKRDTLGLAVPGAWCQSRAFRGQRTVPHRRRWATAHGWAFQHTPARLQNVPSVPQQLPYGPSIRTVMRYLQPTLQASHVTGQQPREGTECWLIVARVLTTHSVFTSHLVPQVTLGKTTQIT